MKRLAILFLLTFLLAAPAWACPFCAPAEADLFSDIDSAQAVVLASLVEPRKYRIDEVLAGRAPLGRVVLAGEPENRNVGGGRQLLLTTAGSPTLPYWSDAPRYLNAQEMEFARGAIALRGQPAARKWDFAARYLGHASEELALSAYSIFATAPLREVQSRASAVGRDRLRAWVRDASRPEEQKALMLLMLLPDLSTADSAWVNQALFGNDKGTLSPMFGPLAVAHIQLSGVAGVERISSRYLAADLPASRILDAHRALVLAAENGGSPAVKSAVVQTFLKELQHPDRGAFAIAPLAFWRVWEAAPQVERLAGSQQQSVWVKVAVIRYFRSFSTPAAAQSLQRLGRSDPDLVARTKDPYRWSDLGLE